MSELMNHVVAKEKFEGRIGDEYCIVEMGVGEGDDPFLYLTITITPECDIPGFKELRLEIGVCSEGDNVERLKAFPDRLQGLVDILKENAKNLTLKGGV